MPPDSKDPSLTLHDVKGFDDMSLASEVHVSNAYSRTDRTNV